MLTISCPTYAFNLTTDEYDALRAEITADERAELRAAMPERPDDGTIVTVADPVADAIFDAHTALLRRSHYVKQPDP